MPPKKSKSAAAAASTASTPNRSKKRKVRSEEEDANALLYFQQLQQKEMLKKQGIIDHTTSRKSLPLPKPAARPRRRTIATTKPSAPKERTPPTTTEVQDDDDEEEVKPSAKRRRIIAPSSPPEVADVVARARAKQWYQEQFLSSPATVSTRKSVASTTATPPPNELTPPPRRAITSRRQEEEKQPQQRLVVAPPPSRSQRKPPPAKAPFGSPLPTLPPPPPPPKLHSPPPSLPTVNDLDLPMEKPTLLSPSYAARETRSSLPPSERSALELPGASVFEEEESRRRWEEEEEGQPHYDYTNTFITVGAVVGVLLAFVLGALVWDTSTLSPLSSSWMTSLWSSSSSNDTLVTRLCFDDYPVRSNLEVQEDLLLEDTPPRCHPEQKRAPCPEGGHCLGGTLKLCYDSKNYQVSADGSACTFSPEALRQREALRDLLTKYTIQHLCTTSARRTSPNPFYRPDSEPPLFDYRAMIDVLHVPYNPKILTHPQEDVFILQIYPEQDGSHPLSIGLHPSQVLEIPLSCWLKQHLISVATALLVWVWTLSVALTSWILSQYLERPLFSGGISVFLLTSWILVRQIQHQRRFLRQVEDQVVQVRERVYQELSHGKREAVPAALIGDRIAWSLFPRSQQQRHRLREVIFPLVTRDIATDGRIRKSWSTTATSSQGPELFWQWVDPQAYAQR